MSHDAKLMIHVSVKSWNLVLWTLLMLAASSPVSAQGPPAGTSRLPTLTRIARIRELTLDQAAQSYPARVTGVVTYLDGFPDLFIQDETAGVFVRMPAVQPGLAPGQLVEVTGVTESPDFAPQINPSRVRVIGRAPMPEAPTVSFSQLISAREDSRWVQVEGIIRSLQSGDGFLTLDLAIGEGSVSVLIPEVGLPLPQRLVDAEVRIRGVCGAHFNSRNQLIGAYLFVPDLDRLRVVEPAPPDPFAQLVRPIDRLLRFTPHGVSSHRVKVQGVVTRQLLGKNLFIQDATGGLFVKTVQNTPLQPGDRVEVAGFATIEGHSPCLRDAIFRRLGRGREPTPVKLTVAQARGGDHDTEIVTIDGRLIDLQDISGDQILTLEAAHESFQAKLRGLGRGHPRFAPPVGGLLRVTGVCSVDVNENHEPTGFSILLRSPSDVMILDRPPWWTVKRTATGVGLLIVVLLVAMGWAVTLERRVREQTGIILQRLQREVALEERYRDLFENANDIVYTHDLVGNYTSLNSAGERCTGYSRDEALRMNLSQMVAPEYLDRTRQTIEAKLKDGASPAYELEIVTKDGRRVPLEVRSRLVYQGGTPIGVQGNARDITERKRTEAVLKNAKEAAEAASSAKGEFLANVSHEIRTPMNGILGMTELVLDTPLTAEQRECLSIVKASADSLLTVINDLLDFSKIEARKLELDLLPFNLRESVRETLKPLAVRAQQKGLEVLAQVQPDVPDALVGDEGRLRQIVVNLLGNAVKFTDHGEVSIKVDVESRVGHEITLHFRVRDTGVGIQFEKQHLIFEAFAQADGSTTRRFGGTGLGLAICSRLVEMMQGRIWLESEPGQGSTFHFTVRLGLAGTSDADQRAAEIGAAPVQLPPELRGQGVLVVDDNTESRRMLTETLTRWQLKPVAVVSADAALVELESADSVGKRFLVVLIDAEMPGADGFWLAERIRQDRRLASTALLMMLTSAGQQWQAVRCRELGLEPYIIKPALDSDFRSAIVAAVGVPINTRAPDNVPDGYESRQSSRPMRILLAEDNRVNQTLAVRLLEKRGHMVVTAENGREALEILEQSGYSGFDAVLMDVQMPEVDGLEATAMIRRREKPAGTHIPIIALTAHAMKGDRERCLEAGMDGYVSKPIRIDDLLAVMEGVLTGSLDGQGRPPDSRTGVSTVQVETTGQTNQRTLK